MTIAGQGTDILSAGPHIANHPPPASYCGGGLDVEWIVRAGRGAPEGLDRRKWSVNGFAAEQVLVIGAMDTTRAQLVQVVTLQA